MTLAELWQLCSGNLAHVWAAKPLGWLRMPSRHVAFQVLSVAGLAGAHLCFSSWRGDEHSPATWSWKSLPKEWPYFLATVHLVHVAWAACILTSLPATLPRLVFTISLRLFGKLHALRLVAYNQPLGSWSLFSLRSDSLQLVWWTLLTNLSPRTEIAVTSVSYGITLMAVSLWRRQGQQGEGDDPTQILLYSTLAALFSLAYNTGCWLYQDRKAAGSAVQLLLPQQLAAVGKAPEQQQKDVDVKQHTARPPVLHHIKQQDGAATEGGLCEMDEAVFLDATPRLESIRPRALHGRGQVAAAAVDSLPGRALQSSGAAAEITYSTDMRSLSASHLGASSSLTPSRADASSVSKDTSDASLPTVHLPEGPEAVAAACLKVSTMLRSAGKGAAYQSRVRRSLASVKVPFAEPEQLPPAFLQHLNDAMSRTAGVMVVGASVRRGCIELSFEVVDVEGGSAQPAGGVAGTASDAAAAWAGVYNARNALHSLADLPVPELMAALGLDVAALSASDGVSSSFSSFEGPASAHSTASDSLARYTVFLSARGEQPRAAVFDEAAGSWCTEEMGSAPTAYPAAVRPWCLLAGQAHAHASRAGGNEGARLSVTLAGVAAGDQGTSYRFVAQAGGRSCAAKQVPGTWQVLEAAADGAAGTTSSLRATCTVELLDPRSLLSSPGLLMLECWQGSVVCGSVPVLVVRSGAVAAELASLGAKLSEEDAPQGPALDDLLTDLGRWVEFCGALDRVAAAGSTGLTAAEQANILDASVQLAHITASDTSYARVMTEAARNLLDYCCDMGMAATAEWIIETWASCPAKVTGGNAALGAALVAPAPVARGPGLTLMHLAVRSEHKAVVELLLSAVQALGTSWSWVATEHTPITPLHFAALQLPDGDGLVDWLLATEPDAAAAWFDAAGPLCTSPATLADACGNGHLTMLAAATLSSSGILVPAAATLMSGALAPALPAHAPPERACTAPAAIGEEFVVAPPVHVPGPTPAASSVAAAADAAGASTSAPPAAVSAAEEAARKEAALVEADIAPRNWLSRMHQACFTGFRSHKLERSYAEHVAARSLGVTRVWAALMVLAHMIVVVKSREDQGARMQAAVGVAGYLANFVLTVTSPAFLIRNREALAVLAVLCRTAARSLIAAGICSTSTCTDTVGQFVHTHLDVLLDGVMEGLFNQISVPRYALLRAIDSLVNPCMYLTLGLVNGVVWRHMRAAVVQLLGLLVTIGTECTWRAVYTRRMRASKPAACKLKAE